MKKLFVTLMAVITAFAIGMGTAEAKRMGGGSSIGKQSSSASRQAQAPMQQQAAPNRPASPATAPNTPAKPSPWKGILGGALLGLGLGALLSHFGLGGAAASMIATMLMIALLVMAAMFIYRMVRRKSANEPRPAYAAPHPSQRSHFEPEQPRAYQGSNFSGAGESNGYGVPADFDANGFVRQAKTQFIRLQAAWDKADVNDIREFTTPEMFAELKMQLQERGAAANHTDVVSLDADMLGVETVGNEYLASVKFYGFIKEDENAAPTQFNEIWNLSKPVTGNRGWLLAGIQQLS